MQVSVRMPPKRHPTLKVQNLSMPESPTWHSILQSAGIRRYKQKKHLLFTVFTARVRRGNPVARATPPIQHRDRKDCQEEVGEGP